MESFVFSFEATPIFLEEASIFISERKYKTAFYAGEQPKYIGENDSKMFIASSIDLISKGDGSLPDELSLELNSLSDFVDLSGETPELNIEELTFTGATADRIDGIFLYSGSQAAFFAPLTTPQSLELLSQIEETDLKFYPSEKFIFENVKENLFNTTTDFYYLGYSSTPLSELKNNTDVSILDGEITFPERESGELLARAYMSNAELILNESAATISMVFSEFKHFGGEEDIEIASSFIVKKPKDENLEDSERVIFQSDLKGTLIRGTSYSGDIILDLGWAIII